MGSLAARKIPASFPNSLSVAATRHVEVVLGLRRKTNLLVDANDKTKSM